MSSDDPKTTELTIDSAELTIDSADEVPDSVLDALRERFRTLGPGDVVNKAYRIDSLLGQGGMGSVFLATQLSMNRQVAIKTLRPEGLQEERHVKRFYREAQAVSKLNHPNIVRVFDFGIDEDHAVPFIVMEYLEGTTLKGLLDTRGALSEAEAVAIVTEIARALVEAHGLGMIHRDLKPENVILRQLSDGEFLVKVLDFGLAKALTPEAGVSMSVSASGVLRGTPTYMSPEQILGEAVDERTDIYGLGCLLYYLLTGDPPYLGDDAITIVMKHVNDPIPALPDVLPDGTPPSTALQEIYNGLMQKDASERPASAADVYQRLKVLKGTPSTQLAGGVPVVNPETTPMTPSVSDSRPGGWVDDLGTQTAQVGLGSRRSPLFWGGLAALVLGLVVIGVMLFDGMNPSEGVKEEESDPATSQSRLLKPPPAQATVESPSKDVSQLSAVPETSQSSARASTSSAKKSPEPSTQKSPVVAPGTHTVKGVVRLSVESDPVGAVVYKDTKSIGTTPLSIVTPTKPMTLTFRLAGHKEGSLSVGPRTRGVVKVVLKKRAVKAKKRRAVKSKVIRSKDTKKHKLRAW
jgi:serine/threonine protein kinase